MTANPDTSLCRCITLAARPVRRWARAMLAFTVLFTAALGARAHAAPQQTPAGRADANAESVLEDNPITIEELGVSLRPPRRVSISKVLGAEGLPKITIAETSPVPVWQMTIQALKPTIENPTPARLIEDHINKLKESGQNLNVLSSKDVALGDVMAYKAYLADPAADEPLVNGYLIAPGKGPQFIVFSFVCPLSSFATVRPTLDQSLDTVRIVSPSEIAREREDLLKAGAAMLEGFDEAALRNLVGLDQWFRIYVPARGASGETEVGVTHVWVKEGMRGELNDERKEAQYDPSEKRLGLLLTVQARVIISPEREQYYDSLNKYWMAWDGSEEAWSILASRKQKSAAQTEAETGYRTAPSTDDPMGSLHVVKSGVDGARRDPKDWKLPEYYLSQPIGWLLGHMLVTNKVPAGTFTYYSYDSTTGNLTLRRDEWDPNGHGTGTATLVSYLTPHAEAITATYDARGNTIRRARTDGSLTVPTTPEEIRRVWEAKGIKLRSES